MKGPMNNATHGAAYPLCPDGKGWIVIYTIIGNVYGGVRVVSPAQTAVRHNDARGARLL